MMSPNAQTRSTIAPLMASTRTLALWTGTPGSWLETTTPAAKSVASTTDSELAIVALLNGAARLGSVAPTAREIGIANARAASHIEKGSMPPPGYLFRTFSTNT